jgi:hypothetical protein
MSTKVLVDVCTRETCFHKILFKNWATNKQKARCSMILGDRVVTKVEQGVHKGKFSVGAVDWPLYSVLKTKQIGINHTQGGIGHSSQPAGQVEGEQ